MATYKNLFIDQGSDFTISIDVEELSSGYTARGQVRRSYSSADAIDFNISVDTSNKELTATLTSAQTGTLKSGRYVYDIEIESADSPSIITRVLEGQIHINPQVTK